MSVLKEDLNKISLTMFLQEEVSNLRNNGLHNMQFMLLCLNNTWVHKV